MRRMRLYLLGVIGIVAAGACDQAGDLPTGTSDVSPAYAKPTAPASDLVAVVLPKLGGGPSEALAINDAQEITGYSGSFPSRWTRSGSGWTVQQLSAAPGRGAAINEAGTIAGTANGTVLLWHRDGTSEIVGAGVATGINGAGTIVVGVRSSIGATAWVRDGAAWTAYSLPRYQGSATGFPHETSGINDAGVIVGYSANATNVQHAVKWMPAVGGGWDAAVAIDSYADANNTAATGIEGEDVVGVGFRCAVPTFCGRDARHWSLSGTSQGSLGTGDIWAEGLNASRSIVGVRITQTRGKFATHAFIWSPSAPTLRDLTKPKGFSDAWAYDVNNATASRPARQIVGYVGNSSGASAVVWILN